MQKPFHRQVAYHSKLQLLLLRRTGIRVTNANAVAKSIPPQRKKGARLECPARKRGGSAKRLGTLHEQVCVLVAEVTYRPSI